MKNKPFLTMSDKHEFLWLQWIVIVLLTIFMLILAGPDIDINLSVLVMVCFVTSLVMVKTFIFFDNRNYTTIYSDTILKIKRTHDRNKKKIETMPEAAQKLVTHQIHCLFDWMGNFMSKTPSMRRQKINPKKEFAIIEKSIDDFLNPCSKNKEEGELIQIIDVNKIILKAEIDVVLSDHRLLVHVRRKEVADRVVDYIDRNIDEMTFYLS